MPTRHRTTYYDLLRESVTMPSLRLVHGQLVRHDGLAFTAEGWQAPTTAAHHPRPKPRMFAGFKVMVENPAGSTRSGVDKDGHEWAVTMKNDYGYLSRTTGADGEGIDVFIANQQTMWSEPKPGNCVYVVHQNDPKTGQYDEDKVMLGFLSEGDAKQAYLSNYDKPDFYRSITSIPVETFRAMLSGEVKAGFKLKSKGKQDAAAALFAADAAEEQITADLLQIIDHDYDRSDIVPKLEALARCGKSRDELARLIAPKLGQHEADAALDAMQNFAADEGGEGRWIQIGAQPGEDGKKHGGTPVHLGPAGIIDKGPAKFVGNKPANPTGKNRPTLASLQQQAKQAVAANLNQPRTIHAGEQPDRHDARLRGSQQPAPDLSGLERLTGAEIRQVAAKAGIANAEGMGMAVLHERLEAAERETPGRVTSHLDAPPANPNKAGMPQLPSDQQVGEAMRKNGESVKPAVNPATAEPAQHPNAGQLTQGPTGAYEVRTKDGKTEGFAVKKQAQEFAKAQGGTGKVEKLPQPKLDPAAQAKAIASASTPAPKPAIPTTSPVTEHEGEGIDRDILENLPEKPLPTHEAAYTAIAAKFGNGQLTPAGMKQAESYEWPDNVVASRLGIPQSQVNDLVKTGAMQRVATGRVKLVRPANLNPQSPAKSPEGKAEASASHFSRKALGAKLTDWAAQHGYLSEEGQNRLEAATGGSGKFTFRGQSFADLPEEVRIRLQRPDGARYKRFFGVSEQGSKVYGEDAISKLGGYDEAFRAIDESLNNQKGSRVEAAIGQAAKSDDPEIRFYAELMANGGTPARGTITRSTTDIPAWTEFTIGGERFRVIEDEDGQKMVQDGGTFTPFPAAAVKELPVDKGSEKQMPEPELPGGDDPFGDVVPEASRDAEVEEDLNDNQGSASGAVEGGNPTTASPSTPEPPSAPESAQPTPQPKPDLKAQILAHLQEHPEASIHDLGRAVGLKPHGYGDEGSPLENPLNRALVDLRDAGQLEAKERGWNGTPHFTLKAQPAATPGEQTSPGGTAPQAAAGGVAERPQDRSVADPPQAAASAIAKLGHYDRQDFEKLKAIAERQMAGEASTKKKAARFAEALLGEAPGIVAALKEHLQATSPEVYQHLYGTPVQLSKQQYGPFMPESAAKAQEMNRAVAGGSVLQPEPTPATPTPASALTPAQKSAESLTNAPATAPAANPSETPNGSPESTIKPGLTVAPTGKQDSQVAPEPPSAMKKDLFGKPFIDSAGIGSQQPLFHEPKSADGPKDDAELARIRARNKASEAATGQMFPEQANKPTLASLQAKAKEQVKQERGIRTGLGGMEIPEGHVGAQVASDQPADKDLEKIRNKFAPSAKATGKLFGEDKPAAAPAAPREPHDMTRAEYREHRAQQALADAERAQRDLEAGKASAKYTRPFIEDRKQQAQKALAGEFDHEHRRHVESAADISDKFGRGIEEYPDLMQQYGRKPTPVQAAREPSAGQGEEPKGEAKPTLADIQEKAREQIKPPAWKPVTPDELPYRLAHAAHAGVSFVPEDRAKWEQKEFAESLNGVYDEMSKLADTPEKKAMLDAEMARYKQGYLDKLGAYLQARSRVISPMITGPARFPVARNEKRNNTADKRREEFLDWDKRARAAIKKRIAPEASGVISSDDPNAPDMLQKKIDAAKAHQERMKRVNAAHTKHLKDPKYLDTAADLSDEDKATIRSYKPAYSWEPHPYAPYELSNNAANIKRMEHRVASIAANRQTSGGERKVGDVRVVENVNENRIQLHYPGKPDEATREKLKRHGFRWSPTNQAWQRQLNQAGRVAAQLVLGE